MVPLNEKQILYLFLIAFFLFLFFLNNYTQFLVWDEVAFLSNAKLLLGETNYREDWFRPPLLSFLIGSFWLIFGKSVLLAKMIVIFLSTLCIYLFFKICCFYFSKKFSLLSTLLLAFNYLILYWGFRIYTDIPSLTFVLLSFYFLKRDELSFAGISAAIAFLFRFVSGLIFVFVAIVTLLSPKDRTGIKLQKIGKFVGGIILAIFPWLVFNSLYYGDPISQLRWNVVTAARWTAPFAEPFWLQIKNFVIALNFLTPFVLLGFFSFLDHYKEEVDKLPYLYFMIFLVQYLFLTHMKYERYWIEVLPWIFLWIVCGLRVSRNFFKRRDYITLRNFNYTVTLLIIFYILFSFVKLTPALQVEKVCWQPLKQSIEYVQPKVNSTVSIFSDFWPYFGFFTNASISLPEKSFYSANELEELIVEQKPKYVISRGGIRGFEEIRIVEQKPFLELEKMFSNECTAIKIYRYIRT